MPGHSTDLVWDDDVRRHLPQQFTFCWRVSQVNTDVNIACFLLIIIRGTFFNLRQCFIVVKRTLSTEFRTFQVAIIDTFKVVTTTLQTFKQWYMNCLHVWWCFSLKKSDMASWRLLLRLEEESVMTCWTSDLFILVVCKSINSCFYCTRP